MAGSQYLYRRESGIYFVRLCVPVRLKAAVGKGEIHRSTGVRDYRLAKIVAAELVAHWHRAIEVLVRMDIKKIKAGSIDLLGEGNLPLVQAALAMGTTASGLAERLRLRRAPFFVQADQWLGWVVLDISDAVEHFPDRVTHEDEYVISSDKLNRVAGAMTRYTGMLSLRLRDEAVSVANATDKSNVCQFMFWPSAQKGFVVDFPGQPLDVSMLLVRRMDVEALRFELASHITPDMLAAMPPVPSVAAAADEVSGLHFSAFMTEYMKRHIGFWKPDQVRRRKDQCLAFLELMGDLTLASIDRATIRRFSDMIARIPDNRHNIKRRFKCTDAGFKDLIELAEKHDLPRMTLQSQQRLMDGISEIFTWAVTETMIVVNPAKGLGGELTKRAGWKSTKAHKARDKFSDDELQRIFAANWFVTGTGKRTPKGDFYAYRPHYYWLPLLALFQGGRLNELSQLYLDDIKVSKEGIAYLDFNLLGEGKLDIDETDREDATDKSLKTVNSQRIVPLHKKVINLGFLEYVNALRAAGHDRLFPELKHDKNKGYGKAAGSWFNERYLGKELGIPRNGRKTFHSLRHNFSSALGTAGAPSNMKSDLMGHVREGSMADVRYDKGGDINTQKMAIDSLTYSIPEISHFNISDGLQAVMDALKLKRRR